MTDLRSRVLRSGGWVAGSTAILAVAQLIQLIVLARVLPQSEFAIVAILVMVQGFVEMLMIAGISNAIIQRQGATAGELSSLHWLNAAVGLMLGLGVVLLAPALGDFFNNPAAALPIAILGLAVPVNAQSHVSRACLERDLSFRSVALVETAAGLTSVLAVVGGSALCGIVGVSFGMLFGFLIRSGLFLYAGRQVFRLRARFAFRETRRFLDFGIFQFLNSLVGFIDGNTATILIGRSLSPTALGGYNLAYNTSVNVPGKINPVITRVMFPALSRLQDDTERFSAAVLRLISMTGTLNAPLMLALAITAPVFVPTVFGAKWGWAVSLVQILALSGFLRALANPMGVVLMAKNRQRLGLTVNAAKTVVSIALMLTGIHFGGVTGAAVALVASGIMTLAVNQVLLRHLLGAGYLAIVRTHLLPALAVTPAAALGAIMMYLVANVWMPIWTLLGVGTLILLVTAVTASALKLPAARQIAELVKRGRWTRGRD
ncbi:MOP flippase family protein [Microbacterium sp.]|uniref:MOP flippase family protein n=1 Tax=Microbacterium sp. TaxID=51671 RepID=UPI00281263A7|nr:MOP flippase family protein [Microbacterium sp.]